MFHRRKHHPHKAHRRKTQHKLFKRPGFVALEATIIAAIGVMTTVTVSVSPPKSTEDVVINGVGAHAVVRQAVNSMNRVLIEGSQSYVDVGLDRPRMLCMGQTKEGCFDMTPYLSEELTTWFTDLITRCDMRVTLSPVDGGVNAADWTIEWNGKVIADEESEVVDIKQCASGKSE